MNSQQAVTLCDIGQRVYSKGLVAASDGNLSVRLNDGTVLATPTGVSKGFMEPAQMVCMNLNGELIGDGRPSSEVKMHLEIYRQNPDIGAVVHTHAPYASMLAAMNEPLETAYLPEAVVMLGNVPVVEFALPGSDTLAEKVAPMARMFNGVLLENHGCVTWAEDLEKAYCLTEILEYCARMQLWQKLLEKSMNPLCGERLEELLKLREKTGNVRGGVPRNRR